MTIRMMMTAEALWKMDSHRNSVITTKDKVRQAPGPFLIKHGLPHNLVLMAITISSQLRKGLPTVGDSGAVIEARKRGLGRRHSSDIGTQMISPENKKEIQTHLTLEDQALHPGPSKSPQKRLPYAPTDNQAVLLEASWQCGSELLPASWS